MSEDWQGLNNRIDELKSLVEGSNGMFSPLKVRSIRHPMGSILPILIHDWRPAWDLAKSIQASFSGGIRYESRQEREAAWTKFNDARNELSKRSNADREEMFSVSKAWRDLLFSDINTERYSKFTDVLFFFDPTTVEDMKASGRRLKECGARLSDAKESMLKEHKDECFQQIVEVRQSHDVFWQQYKASREQRHREIGERIEGVLGRIEDNISKNREKRSNAEDALSRCEANIDKLRDMLSTAKGDDFRSQVEGRLSEAYAKKDSIRGQLRGSMPGSRWTQSGVTTSTASDARGKTWGSSGSGYLALRSVRRRRSAESGSIITCKRRVKGRPTRSGRTSCSRCCRTHRPARNGAASRPLSRVIGADRETTTRLLIEIGARGSEREEDVWALESGKPLP